MALSAVVVITTPRATYSRFDRSDAHHRLTDGLHPYVCNQRHPRWRLYRSWIDIHPSTLNVCNGITSIDQWEVWSRSWSRSWWYEPLLRRGVVLRILLVPVSTAVLLTSHISVCSAADLEAEPRTRSWFLQLQLLSCSLVYAIWQFKKISN